MKNQHYSGTHITSMCISDRRLLQFIMLFEGKTGRKLEEVEALTKAETLLRTISILYKPLNKADYYSALARKMWLKTKNMLD